MAWSTTCRRLPAPPQPLGGRFRRRPARGALAAGCCLLATLGCLGRLGQRAWAHGPTRPLPRTSRQQLRAAVAGSTEFLGELKPLSGYVLVKPKDAATSTKGGLLLPNAAQDKPSEGEVLGIGPGKMEDNARKPMWTQVGMKVMYGKYGAEKVEVDDVEHVLVRDDDVLLSYSGEEPTLENIRMPTGKVLVQLREENTVTEGGLLLSRGAAKPKTTIGEVAAVSEGILGDDGELVPLDVEVGDSVRFRYGSEVKLEVGKAEYRVVDAESCLAKWRESP